MATVYIGIGSNLGNREENCEWAIKLLFKNGITVSKRSSMFETAPWRVIEQPDFINMAIEIETELPPDELLQLLKNIEVEVGRLPTSHWGPRVIDLDILLYDDQIINRPELEIPHRNIADREFVLKPLTEIAPERIHPVLKKSIRKLLSELRLVREPSRPSWVPAIRITIGFKQIPENWRDYLYWRVEIVE